MTTPTEWQKIRPEGMTAEEWELRRERGFKESYVATWKHLRKLILAFLGLVLILIMTPAAEVVAAWVLNLFTATDQVAVTMNYTAFESIFCQTVRDAGYQCIASQYDQGDRIDFEIRDAQGKTLAAGRLRVLDFDRDQDVRNAAAMAIEQAKKRS